MSKARQLDENFNRLIGTNIKLQRKMKGMGADELASHLGITQQQLYKYENGSNRVSAEYLYHIAEALSVNVTVLYGSDESETLTASGLDTQYKQDKNFADLYKVYSKIEDKKVRKNVLNLLKNLTS